MSLTKMKKSAKAAIENKEPKEHFKATGNVKFKKGQVEAPKCTSQDSVVQITDVQEGFDPQYSDNVFTLKSFPEKVVLNSRTTSSVDYGFKIKANKKMRPAASVPLKYAEKGLFATAIDDGEYIQVFITNAGKEIIVLDKETEFANLWFVEVFEINSIDIKG